MRLRWRLLLPALAGLGLSLALAGSALAATAPPMNRGEWYGYFDNRCEDYGGEVFAHPAGADAMPLSRVHDAASLIQFMKDAYNSGSGEDRTGEAYVVLSMDGYRTPPAGTNANNISPTSSYFKKFEDIVNYYAANRWIAGINTLRTSTGYAYNTYWQSGPGTAGCNNVRNDDAWYKDSGSSAGVIIFHDPNTSKYYIIRRHCGNPLGSDQLTIPNFNVTVSLNPHGTPPKIEMGKTYTLGVALDNHGTTPSEYGSLQITQPAQIVAPCTPWCNGSSIGQSNLVPNYTYSYGFANNPANADPGVSGNRWTWYTNPIPGRATPSAWLTFTVSPTAVPGSTITFKAYFYPSTLTNGESTATYSFTVVSVRTPAVTGLNGDVQAGGGLCGRTQYNGFIQGYAGAGSYAQYVLSAGAGTNSITDFNSNGTGANILNLGQNGGYNTVCREDLLSEANAYRSGGGAGFSTRPGGSLRRPADYDISGWTGIYYIDGYAHIHGTVSNKLTIVVNAPTLTIVAPGITLTGAGALPQDVPSLGIIASNDIDIQSTVTRVDAYMFADGTIDTCSGPGSCSTPQLVVNGFLMAHNILFNRLGPYDTNGRQIAEKVVLNPQIYLNPPQFFSSSVDQALIEGQGEKPPLY